MTIAQTLKRLVLELETNKSISERAHIRFILKALLIDNAHTITAQLEAGDQLFKAATNLEFHGGVSGWKKIHQLEALNKALATYEKGRDDG